METDPQELQNQYDNPEYADIRERLHGELNRLREVYEVPGNEIQDLTNVDQFFHSTEIRKRGIERRKMLEAKQKE